jgi:DNA-binding beta-propeller fold protein YncE
LFHLFRFFSMALYNPCEVPMKTKHTRREFLQLTTAMIAGSATLYSQAAPARVQTIVGTGVAGVAADGDTADHAQINNPFGVVIGPDGGLYWCDFGSSRILRLDLMTKKISVIAGTGTAGYSGDGGPAKGAQLRAPHEVRFNSRGDLYFVERDNHIVRRVDMKTRMISTVAGTGMRGYAGDGGPANKAQLSQPHGIAFDKTDNMYVCDISNNVVRKIDAKTGKIESFAGSGERSRVPDEGGLTEIPLTGPRSIEIAPNGAMYLALREGNAVMLIDPVQRKVKRIAGIGATGYAGDGGPAISARFGGSGGAGGGPTGLGFADGMLYIVDTESFAIRKMDLTSGIINTVLGTGDEGDGPEGDPLMCKLARPHGIFVRAGVVYIADSENHRIRVLR